MVAVRSWGRLSAAEHQVHTLGDRHRLAFALERATPGVAHGMGRSYGDVCLNPGGHLWSTRALDHFISFDPATGRLVCEAGVLLRDIQRLMVPRGWMLPVTPGTQMVTVGGAIANDVHGKNHHVQGSFGDHVERIRLLRTDGTVIDCGPSESANWFEATVGGLGLTGLVVEAALRMRPVAGPWLDTETLPFTSLGEFFQLADSSEKNWEYTVSWIDCLSGAGRGVFMRANHSETNHGAEPVARQLGVPFVPPVSLVNPLSLRPFNAAYFRLQTRQRGLATSHYRPFFYPLDNLLEWNRMYGPRGFYQYQSVVPRASGEDAIKAMLKAISHAGQGSFLAVLKTFGDRLPLGMLSFPQPGVTLALDFPNKGADTLRLLEQLDAIVREAGGRIYPAKDARMPRELFERGYPRLPAFTPFRDPGISSAMSRRLFGS